MTDEREKSGDMSCKKVGRTLFLVLVIIFTLLIVLGVRARRHIVTGGIAGYVCLECMGFK